MKKNNELIVSDDEADEQNIEHEFDSRLEEDNHNTDLNHDNDLSVSDRNAF